ncbi:hypothetical protein [Vibrio phage BONAISHI]|nr:hypothetical protein [Vibrio phage BONAISHI]
MSNKKLVLGIGDTDVPSSIKREGGGYDRTPYYYAWSTLLRALVKNTELKPSEKVLKLSHVQDSLIKQGYDNTLHTIKMVPSSWCIDESPKGKVDIEDIFIVDRCDSGLFASPRGKRDLPLWVTNPKDCKGYRANIAVFNPEHYDLFGYSEVLYKFGPDPMELHYWAMDHKIRSLELLLGKYPPFGQTQTTHRAINKVINKLKLVASTKEEALSC